MTSGDKLPFTRRRKGFKYFLDSESEDEDHSDHDNEKCLVEGAQKRKSDHLDGEIQRLDRAKLFENETHNDADDVIDFLPREKKREILTESYQNHEDRPARASHDSRDLGVYRKEVPPTEAEVDHRCRQRQDFVYEFGWFELVIGFGSIIVFVADFGSDINLVVQYFREGQILYGSVSCILTAGPSLVTCFLGLHWYILDFKREQDELTKASQNPKRLEKMRKLKTSNCQWALRFSLTLLQFGPVIRVAEYMYYGYKSKNMAEKIEEIEKSCHDRIVKRKEEKVEEQKTIRELEEKKKRYHNKMLFEDVDACLLRLFESFLESAPQLTWQLYVWIILRDHNDVVTLYMRIFTLLSSWLALSISLVSYHRSLRYSRDEKMIMRRRAIPFYFIWRSSEVGNRVLCICLFASTFHAIVFIPVGIHWFVISAWLMCQKTSFYGHRGFEIIFNIICGYVMIFCFLNVKEGHTRFRYLMFYIIFYVESFSMLTVWFMYSSHIGEWFHVGGLAAVALMSGLHVFFQIMYYTQCHPTGDIQSCLPCDRNTCYELVCHDLKEDKEVKRDPLNMEITVKPPKGKHQNPTPV